MSEPENREFNLEEAIQKHLAVWERAAGHERPSEPDVPIDEATDHALAVIFKKGKLPPNGNPLRVLPCVAAAVIYLSRLSTRKRYAAMAHRCFQTTLNIGASSDDIWSDTYGAVLGRLADPNPKLEPVRDLLRFSLGAAQKLFYTLIESEKARLRALATLRQKREPSPPNAWLHHLEIKDELLRFIQEKRRRRPDSMPQLKAFALAVVLLLDNPTWRHSDALRKVAERANGRDVILPSRSTFSRWLDRLRRQIRRGHRSAM
ncbi:MAG TPA: hypothetical protein VNA69_20570 [Thermoanaerobaculia bacterium]|nr:hypothetical protein [Thermoanaerobaculia bacterium]